MARREPTGRKPGRPAKVRLGYQMSGALRIPPPVPDRDPKTGQIRTREAAVALAKMRAPEFAAHFGIKIASCDGFAPYNAQRLRWGKARITELSQMYGLELSRGVGARVRSAAWGFAFGEWLCARAAHTGDVGLTNLAMQVLTKASAEDARACELAQIEARIRTQQARPIDLSALTVEEPNDHENKTENELAGLGSPSDTLAI